VENGAEEEEVASTRPERVEARRGEQGMHALKLQGVPVRHQLPEIHKSSASASTLIKGVEWKILFSNFSRIAIDRPGL